jgi:hypothetical protein
MHVDTGVECTLNTLGTGYLNYLYAYKRKSASPVLNVLSRNTYTEVLFTVHVTVCVTQKKREHDKLVKWQLCGLYFSTVVEYCQDQIPLECVTM